MSGPSKDLADLANETCHVYLSVINVDWCQKIIWKSLSAVVSNNVEIKTWLCQLLTFCHELAESRQTDAWRLSQSCFKAFWSQVTTTLFSPMLGVLKSKITHNYKVN